MPTYTAAFLAIRASMIDPEVLLHLRYDLWISQFVCGLNFDNILRQRLGGLETLSCSFLTRPEDQRARVAPTD